MNDQPPRPPAVKRTAEFPPVQAKGSKPVVLVVDDDWEICEALQEALEDAGFEAVCVANGLMGLQHLERNPRPAVILLDLMMPIMDGWTFFRRLRAAPGLGDIPVVVLTAAGPHWGYPAPIVVRKPLGRNELVQAVRTAISRNFASNSSSGTA